MLLSFTPASPDGCRRNVSLLSPGGAELAADLRRIAEASASSSEARPLLFAAGLRLHATNATHAYVDDDRVPLRPLTGPLISIRSDCPRERLDTKRPTHLAEDDSATHSAKSTTLRARLFPPSLSPRSARAQPARSGLASANVRARGRAGREAAHAARDERRTRPNPTRDEPDRGAIVVRSARRVSPYSMLNMERAP